MTTKFPEGLVKPGIEDFTEEAKRKAEVKPAPRTQRARRKKTAKKPSVAAMKQKTAEAREEIRKTEEILSKPIEVKKPQTGLLDEEEEEIRKEFLANFAAGKVLDAPATLMNKDAVTKWEDLMNAYASCPEVEISRVDSSALVLFCNTWAVYMQACREFAEHGGTIVSDDGDEFLRLEHIRKSMASSIKTMQSLMPALWLTPAGRVSTALSAVKLQEERKRQEQVDAASILAKFAINDDGGGESK